MYGYEGIEAPCPAAAAQRRKQTSESEMKTYCILQDQSEAHGPDEAQRSTGGAAQATRRGDTTATQAPGGEGAEEERRQHAMQQSNPYRSLGAC